MVYTAIVVMVAKKVALKIVPIVAEKESWLFDLTVLFEVVVKVAQSVVV